MECIVDEGVKPVRDRLGARKSVESHIQDQAKNLINQNLTSNRFFPCLRAVPEIFRS